MSYAKLKEIIFFGFFTGVFFFLFYSQVYNHYPSDVTVHIQFYKQFIEGSYNSSYPMFYTFIYLFDVIGMTTEDSTVLVLVLLTISIIFLIYWILRENIKTTENERLFLIGFLMVIAAIFIPFFNVPFLGQGSSNVWHNPTLLVVKPFAYFSIVYFMKISLNDQGKFNDYLKLTLFLLFSLVAKPNFIIFFVPSVIIYMLIYHIKNIGIWIKMSIISIPVVVVLLIQYFITFNSTSEGGIAFKPFLVWNVYSPNWFVSFLLSIAFPLSLIVLNKRVMNIRTIIFCWIATIVAFVQFALLAETGAREYDGNWGWGVQISIPILFLFSTIEWFKWIKENGETKRKVIVNSIFTLQIVSGVFYLIKLLLGYSYH